MLLGPLSGLGEDFRQGSIGWDERAGPSGGSTPRRYRHRWGRTRHTTPGIGRYGLPAWVVVPDDLQLPVRDGQLPGWSPAATVIDFHLPDQLRRAIPRAHLDEWITVFEQQERTALAALDEAAAAGILGVVTVYDGSCGKVDLVGVLFNLRATP